VELKFSDTFPESAMRPVFQGIHEIQATHSPVRHLLHVGLIEVYGARAIFARCFDKPEYERFFARSQMP